MNHILISGIPAAGKSHFGAWAEANHSFLHIDVEKDGRLQSYGLVDLWNLCFEPGGDVRPFLQALDRHSQQVLINWGFPPECLAVVKKFKAEGAVVWWFDADYSAARESFMARGDVSLAAFDAQMAKINRGWADIRSTFDPNILTTLSADGSRMPPESIHLAMVGAKLDQA